MLCNRRFAHSGEPEKQQVATRLVYYVNCPFTPPARYPKGLLTKMSSPIFSRVPNRVLQSSHPDGYFRHPASRIACILSIPNPGIHIRQIPRPEKPTWDPIRIEGDPRATFALARRIEFFNPVIPTPTSAQSRWFFSASRNPCILSFQNLALFCFKIPDNIQYPVKPTYIYIYI